MASRRHAILRSAIAIGVALAMTRQRRAAPMRAEERPDREFLESRGIAPPNARREALAQIREWHTTHDAAASLPNWTSIGPRPVHGRFLDENGRVTAVVVSPVDPKIIVIGTAGGGIWRSVDRGATFAPVSDDQADINVGAIAMAPSNPNTLYAGMGQDHLGGGVLKSTDGGATWHVISDSSYPAYSTVAKIVVDPTNENIVWLAQNRGYDSNGVRIATGALLKSSDGGRTWQPSFDGLAHDVLITSADGQNLIIGTSRRERPGTGGIYRTTDGGVTWTLVYVQGDSETPPHYYLAQSGSTLLAMAIDEVNETPRRELMVSTDGGATWSKRANAPLDFTPLYLAADPRDGTVYYGAVGLWRSTDGGLTFKTVAGIHPDHHAIAFDPVKPDRIWFGGDGGLWVSDDRGLSVRSLADRVTAVQFYGVFAHPTDPHILFGGAQDNGMERRGVGEQWSELVGGDGNAVVFDPPTGRMLFAFQAGFIDRVPDNGSGTPVNIATEAKFENDRMLFIPPFVRGNDGTVWFASYRLYASHDFGVTWSKPGGTTDLTKGDSDSSVGDVISAVAVSASDPHTLYTGSASGRIMITRDAGVTYSDISPGIDAYVSAFAIDRTTPDVTYIAFRGYGSPHVMKTTDAGKTWTNRSEGLPKVPVNALIMMGDAIFAGTDIGVFRSTNGGELWEPFDNGMPPVIVTSFTVTADGRLVAGTYGRGAYEMDFVPAPAGAPRQRAVRH
jgi:photosystem II stability/assembly factor-like uncharacterized protein